MAASTASTEEASTTSTASTEAASTTSTASSLGAGAFLTSGLFTLHPVLGSLAPVSALCKLRKDIERVGVLSERLIVRFAVLELVLVQLDLDACGCVLWLQDLDEGVRVRQAFLADLTEVEVFADRTFESDTDDRLDSATVALHILMLGYFCERNFGSVSITVFLLALLDDLLDDIRSLTVKLLLNKLLDNLVLGQWPLLTLVTVAPLVASVLLTALLVVASVVTSLFV